MEKQYIYILTNSEKHELIKVGRTNKHPEIRANELSRQTGTIGKLEVEWHLEVTDSEIAEKVAHFKLREFHHSKEYFSISAFKARGILEKALIHLFELENPVIFNSEFLKKKFEEMRVRINTAKELAMKLTSESKDGN